MFLTNQIQHMSLYESLQHKTLKSAAPKRQFYGNASYAKPDSIGKGLRETTIWWIALVTVQLPQILCGYGTWSPTASEALWYGLNCYEATDRFCYKCSYPKYVCNYTTVICCATIRPMLRILSEAFGSLPDWLSNKTTQVCHSEFAYGSLQSLDWTSELDWWTDIYCVKNHFCALLWDLTLL